MELNQSSLLNETTTLAIDMMSDDYFEFESENNDYYDQKLLVKLILFVPIYVITFLTGIIGNGLVIFSILTVKSLRNITNIFLVSLATADLMLIIICVPLKVCILILQSKVFFFRLAHFTSVNRIGIWIFLYWKNTILRYEQVQFRGLSFLNHSLCLPFVSKHYFLKYNSRVGAYLIV